MNKQLHENHGYREYRHGYHHQNNFEATTSERQNKFDADSETSANTIGTTTNNDSSRHYDYDQDDDYFEHYTESQEQPTPRVTPSVTPVVTSMVTHSVTPTNKSNTTNMKDTDGHYQCSSQHTFTLDTIPEMNTSNADTQSISATPKYSLINIHSNELIVSTDELRSSKIPEEDDEDDELEHGIIHTETLEHTRLNQSHFDTSDPMYFETVKKPIQSSIDASSLVSHEYTSILIMDTQQCSTNIMQNDTMQIDNVSETSNTTHNESQNNTDNTENTENIIILSNVLTCCNCGIHMITSCSNDYNICLRCFFQTNSITI